MKTATLLRSVAVCARVGMSEVCVQRVGGGVWQGAQVVAWLEVVDSNGDVKMLVGVVAISCVGGLQVVMVTVVARWVTGAVWWHTGGWGGLVGSSGHQRRRENAGGGGRQRRHENAGAGGGSCTGSSGSLTMAGQAGTFWPATDHDDQTLSSAALSATAQWAL
ncbi:MAG: hypothetical protein H7836_01955 [Magnetococcus sp. YQC-3]